MPDILDLQNFLGTDSKRLQAVRVMDTLTLGTIYNIDFRDYEIDGQRFIPQGLIIDGTNSTAPTTVTIRESAFSISCPAGGVLMVPYPAPADQSATYTGEGATRIFFVEYVVFPFSTGAGGGAGGDASAANQLILNAAIGSPSDAAWDMVSADATLISIAKAIALNTQTVLVDEG